MEKHEEPFDGGKLLVILKGPSKVIGLLLRDVSMGAQPAHDVRTTLLQRYFNV